MEIYSIFDFAFCILHLSVPMCGCCVLLIVIVDVIGTGEAVDFGEVAGKEILTGGLVTILTGGVIHPSNIRITEDIKVNRIIMQRLLDEGGTGVVLDLKPNFGNDKVGVEEEGARSMTATSTNASELLHLVAGDGENIVIAVRTRTKTLHVLPSILGHVNAVELLRQSTR